MDETQQPSEQPNTTIRNAPVRGSFAYWFWLIISTFIFPFVFISMFSTTTFVSFEGSILALNSATFWVISLVALIISSITLTLMHRKLSNMSEEEYYRSVKYIDCSCESGIERYRPLTESPYDPASSLYWTMGPGSHHYRR